MSQAEVEEVFWTRVTANAGVSALISTRFYRDRFPKHKSVDELEWPASVYSRISGVSDETHEGISGLEMDRYQVDSWGRSGKEARAVSRALENAFRKLAGVESGATLIQKVSVDLGPSRYDSDRELYGSSQDIMIYYRR